MAPTTKVRTCSVDRNGRLRRPDGRYATQNDARRTNAKRIAHQLARWEGARVTAVRS